jgi:alpha-mannosidase
MQQFVDISDGMKGLMVATDGLPEYEILRDGNNTIAVTLLRCVGELGDWNVFPTPGAQCLGPYEARLAIIPHGGGYEQGIREVESFLLPYRAVSSSPGTGSLPAVRTFLRLDAETPSLLLTSLKKAEQNDAIVARMVNVSDSDVLYVMQGNLVESGKTLNKVRLDETVNDSSVFMTSGNIKDTAKAKKIVSWIL